MELTTKAQEALQAAIRDAAASGHAQVEPAHLLMALAGQPDTTTGPLLDATGASARSAAQAAATVLASLPRATGSTMGNPQFSRAMHGVIKDAQQAMSAMGDSFVSTDHLLLALARTGQFPLLDAAAIEERIPTLRGGKTVDSAEPEATFDALGKYLSLIHI